MCCSERLRTPRPELSMYLIDKVYSDPSDQNLSIKKTRSTESFCRQGKAGMMDSLRTNYALDPPRLNQNAQLKEQNILTTILGGAFLTKILC
jgi:hypothetical protein